ncbi:AraC family transcriptional regulator, partial [Clostridium perfringens]
YTLGSMTQDQLPSFEAGQNAVLKDGTYYFAEAGSDGLTYVSAGPYSHVSSQLSRLTGGLLLIFCLSLGVALAASYFLSRRLHKPVKQILTTVLKRANSTSMPESGSITEYDLIQNRIQELVREKEEIR